MRFLLNCLTKSLTKSLNKNSVSAILVISCLLNGQVFANDEINFNLDNEVSIGMAIPNPAGITIKYWTSDTHAIAVFGAWSTSDSKYTFQADYLTHDFKAIPMEPGAAPFYYGIGVRVKSQKRHSTETSIRIPIGVSYLMDTAPLDMFAEAGPRLQVAPETKFKLNIMLGIRYRFMP